MGSTLQLHFDLLKKDPVASKVQALLLLIMYKGSYSSSYKRQRTIDFFYIHISSDI